MFGISWPVSLSEGSRFPLPHVSSSRRAHVGARVQRNACWALDTRHHHLYSNQSTLIHTTSTTADDLVSVQHLRHRRLRSRKATCRFMHALFTFCAFPPACSCDLFTLSVERAWSCAAPTLESGRPPCSLRDQSHCAESLPMQIRRAGRGPTGPSGRRQTTRSWPSTR